MKKQDIKKLREKGSEDLEKEMNLTKDNLWKMKGDLASGKVKNIKEIHKLKRTMAVIKTLINIVNLSRNET